MAISRHNLAPLLVIVVALMLGSNAAEDFQVFELNPVPIIVILDAESSPIVIRSPHFGRAYYDNNTNYTLTIRSAGDPLVLKFDFRQFDVEYEQSCRYDALYLQGEAYCGTCAVGRQFSYIVDFREFTINFRTDYSVRRSGFEILVEPKPFPDYEDDPDSSGDYEYSPFPF